jgi:hypothetical protein
MCWYIIWFSISVNIDTTFCLGEMTEEGKHVSVPNTQSLFHTNANIQYSGIGCIIVGPRWRLAQHSSATA